MRVFIAWLCALHSIACADGAPTVAPGPGMLALETDAGADADSGHEPVPCDWFVASLTRMNVARECNWGMRSNDPSIALFRTNGGECLAPATVCGIPACSDLTYVKNLQVIEVWGPAGLTTDEVWIVTESFDCE